MTGQPTGGKPINLSQLEAELVAAGVSADGLGMDEDMAYVYPYDAGGEPVDFTAVDQPKVDQTISDHVGMRDKTDAEYAAEFQDANTTAVRKQEIRDITGGLLPREQLPITQEEWDERVNPASVA
jgi:hypothetical protein